MIVFFLIYLVSNFLGKPFPIAAPDIRPIVSRGGLADEKDTSYISNILNVLI